MYKFWGKNRQVISYAIFGVLTSIANLATYQALILWFDYKISNLIAIIFAKILAYIVNKKFVFHTKCANITELLKEMFRYVLARGFTGVIDYFGLIFLVEFCKLDEAYMKYFTFTIVIILNYILGKKTVFIQNKDL